MTKPVFKFKVKEVKKKRAVHIVIGKRTFGIDINMYRAGGIVLFDIGDETYSWEWRYA